MVNAERIGCAKKNYLSTERWSPNIRKQINLGEYRVKIGMTAIITPPMIFPMTQKEWGSQPKKMSFYIVFFYSRYNEGGLKTQQN